MRPSALRRLKALALVAVLLVGGGGASVLDLALYHLGGAGADGAMHRIGGTEAPRTHGDTCVLLDWAARGPCTVALSPLPPRQVAPEAERSLPIRVDEPRPADLFGTSRPRAPPVPLA